MIKIEVRYIDSRQSTRLVEYTTVPEAGTTDERTIRTPPVGILEPGQWWKESG